MYAIVPFAPRVLLLVLAAALALAQSIPHALAQSWPQHTVKLIIPLPPGTGTDIAGRLLAERLAGRWSQPVVVENKQGGDGIPAATAALAPESGQIDHLGRSACAISRRCRQRCGASQSPASRRCEQHSR